MSRLLIVVPRSRLACGRVTFVAKDGRSLLAPMRVLATASVAIAKKHGNPTCDRTRPFGHPPQGTYLFAGSLPPRSWPKPRRARRFGSVGAIMLVGASGEALTAARSGRKLFHLHGGPSDGKGRLRPTRGGFRMLDRDLVSLFVAINEAQLRGDPLETIEVVDVVLPPGPRAPGERILTRKRRRRHKERREMREQSALPAVPAFTPAILLAAKLLGDRRPDVRKPVARRDVLALAALITGVAASGCRERPSRRGSVSCDPNEGPCPTGGGSSSSGGWDDSGGDG